MRDDYIDSLAELRFDGGNMFDGDYPPGVTGKMIDRLDDPRCCDNCTHYDGTYCTKEWNNLDEDYLITERDKKNWNDFCDDWEAE